MIRTTLRGAVRRAGPLAALLAAGACMPLVTHGPRVEPGVRTSSTIGVPQLLCDTPCDDARMIPRMGVGVRHGWVPSDPNQPAFLAGLSFAGFDLLAPELDLYAQGPGRQGAFAYGGGALVSPRHLMPYVQLGADAPNRPAFYVTAGYAWLLQRPEYYFEGPPDEPGYRHPRFWAPSAHLKLPFPPAEAAVEVYAQGAIGHYHAQVTDVVTGAYTSVRRPIRLLSLGVTLHQRAPERGQFPGRRRPPRFPPPLPSGAGAAVDSPPDAESPRDDAGR
jgi:hypothetical protein